MTPVNEVELDAGEERQPNRATYERFLADSGLAREEMSKPWVMVKWMMKNIYDPNTVTRLQKLMNIVDRDLDNAVSNLRSEIQGWMSELENDDEVDYKEELEDLKRRAGLSDGQN